MLTLPELYAEGVAQFSPGQRPGDESVPNTCTALKGRNKTMCGSRSPLQGSMNLLAQKLSPNGAGWDRPRFQRFKRSVYGYVSNRDALNTYPLL